MKTHFLKRRRPRCRVLLLVLAVILEGQTTLTMANAEEKGGTYSALEQAILAEVTAGREIVLTNQFPKPEDRRINAAFIKHLLTGTNIAVPDIGVRITGAVVTNELNLGDRTIPFEVWLDSCVFEQSVILENSRFGRRLTFDGTKFQGELRAPGLRVAEELQMENTVFSNNVDLSGLEATQLSIQCEFQSNVVFDSARLKGDFLIFGSRFHGLTNSLKRMTVGGQLEMGNTFFNGGPVFDDCNVTQSLFALGATFLQKASFAWMQVGGRMDFRPLLFDPPPTHNPVPEAGKEWTFNYISQTLTNAGLPAAAHYIFKPTRLTNVSMVADPAAGINYRLNVDTNGFPQVFRVSTFGGDLDLTGIDVRGGLYLSASILTPTNALFLNNAKIGGDLDMSEMQLGGPLFAEGAHVSGAWIAYSTEFSYGAASSTFFSVEVGRNMNFWNSYFQAAPRFTSSKINGSLDFTDCTFEGTNVFTLEQIVIGANLAGSGLSCSAPFRFVGGDIGGAVNMENAGFPNATNSLVMDSVQVKGSLYWNGISCGAPVSLGSLDIGGGLEMAGAFFLFDTNLTDEGGQFRFGVFLSEIKAKHIVFSGIYLGSNCSCQFNSLTYSAISGAYDDEKTSCDKLLELYGKARFSVENYANLERHYRLNGEEDLADGVFLKWHDRERRESNSWMQKTGSFLLSWLVNYGKNPSWAWGWSLLVIVIGCIVFRDKNKMEPQDLEKAERIYNPFWYSFDLFLPIVKLSSADFWKPKPKHPFLRTYMRIHTLLGWGLVPLGLAALTGLIK